MLKFQDAWRFESPSGLDIGVVNDFSDLIAKITTQSDDLQSVLEKFKAYFASAAGSVSSWSSNAGWAQSDLDSYMRSAANNAPLFIEAFFDCCESLKKKGMAVPDVQLINRILAKYETGYQVNPPQLHYHGGDLGPVEFAPDNLSLDEQAHEVIQKSLNQAERLLAQGNGRQAVQEVLWLLETVSTAFQGLQIDTGTIQGKYFNKIVEDLRRKKPDTTLEQALNWMTILHGYLSSPTGGGIRHGGHLKKGIPMEPHDSRLFCNLVRSYIAYLLAEHERLTGQRTVLN